MSDIIKIREKLREYQRDLKEGQGSYIEKSIFGDFWEFGKQLVAEYGFVNIEYCYPQDEEPHIYFERHKRKARWEYLNEYLKDIPKEWKCIDIGSGANPWPRANIIVDVYEKFRDYKYEHQVFERCDIINLDKSFGEKEFSFVTLFHVLEHVSDPIGAAQKISYISKSGLIECPHPFKDGMLGFQEQDHRWIVLPGKGEYHMYFYPIDRIWFEKFDDADVRGALYRTYIGNRDNIGDRAIIRNYFERIEKDLNVIIKWEGELKIKVIE